MGANEMILTRKHIGERVRRPEKDCFDVFEGVVEDVNDGEVSFVGNAGLRSADPRRNGTGECELVEDKKMDKEKIRKTIDQLPICDDGKKGVTALVEEIIGEKLKRAFPREKALYGSVWRIGIYDVMLCRTGIDHEAVLVCTGKSAGISWDYQTRHWDKVIALLEENDAELVFEAGKFVLEGRR
jgi:hypothetical protein